MFSKATLDFLDRHAALAEVLAIHEYHRHGHDLARLDFALEQRAIDHRTLDVRVEHGHEVQRLHDIGAVAARKRDECCKSIDSRSLLRFMSKALSAIDDSKAPVACHVRLA